MAICVCSVILIVSLVAGTVSMIARDAKVGISWIFKTPEQPACLHAPINNTVTTGPTPGTQFAIGATPIAPNAMTITEAPAPHV